MIEEFLFSSDTALAVERFLYLFISFIYAIFESITLSFVVLTSFNQSAYSYSFLPFSFAIIVWLSCFVFFTCDGFRILTKSKKSAVNNVEKFFHVDDVKQTFGLKQVTACAYLAVLLVGFFYLIPYHFASTYFIHYLSLNMHFSLRADNLLSWLIMPNLLINAVNIFNNTLVSLDSFYSAVRDASTFSWKRNLSRQNVSWQNFFPLLQLFFQVISIRFAYIMALGNYKTYHEHIIHYNIILRKSVTCVKANKALLTILFFRSYGNCFKLSAYLVSMLRSFVGSLSSKERFYALLYSSSYPELLGYFFCAIRAYARAITVSGNSPMFFSFGYEFFDKSSSNPVASFSLFPKKAKHYDENKKPQPPSYTRRYVR